MITLILLRAITDCTASLNHLVLLHIVQPMFTDRPRYAMN